MLGRHGEALDELNKGAAVLPEDLEGRAWRAETLYRLGRFKEAIEETQADPIFINSSHFYFRVVRGLSWAALGDNQAMEKDFDSIDSEVITFVSKKMGITAGNSVGNIRRILEGILELSQGVRRGAYEGADRGRTRAFQACDP